MNIRENKKLLFITTGGTIACGKGESLSPCHSGEELLKKSGITGVKADILDLFAIDSTDLSGDYLKRIYTAVKDNLPHYDGAVILHGTDTLCYTAAMLGFTVKDKPVIVTGSMRPLSEKDSDGYDNIRLAFKAAISGNYKGCYVAFGGRIMDGRNVAKTDSHSPDAFRPYCEEVTTLFKEHFPENPRPPKAVKLTPFTEGREILCGEEYSGLVIETYGAGGLPEREDILERVKEFSAKKPVVITTPCLSGTDLKRYSVGQRALDCGCVDLGLSTEAAAVWLWLNS